MAPDAHWLLSAAFQGVSDRYVLNFEDWQVLRYTATLSLATLGRSIIISLTQMNTLIHN